MVYGIISDIHSNLEAITAVMGELTRRGTNKIACLGDTVGYGANPNECCDLVRNTADYVVRGNHDAGSTGLISPSNFNRPAIHACAWTSKILSAENRKWLTELPFLIDNEEGTLTHGAPSNPQAWKYVISLGDAVTEFESSDFDICFVGHSHCPVIFAEHKGRYSVIEDSTFTLASDARYIINPGSVGQPRDGNSRASFAVYDSSKRQVQIIRVPYDIAGTQKKILDAGLPSFLAERLEDGR
jgi:diadenosine tetraphosphatase ApaH/serine/threonine PP2A family protein phosphatase